MSEMAIVGGRLDAGSEAISNLPRHENGERKPARHPGRRI
jgi:hypothetical protein